MPEVKTYISRLKPYPFTHVSHCPWKQLFRVFHTGLDLAAGQLESTKCALSYFSRYIVSQNPCLRPQSVHHIGTEVPQIANIATMAETFINCSRDGPTRPHTSPMDLGHKNTFWVRYEKKLTGACFCTHDIQRVGSFLDNYDPMPLDASKHWESSLGGILGSGPKAHWRICLFAQNNEITRS